MCSNRVSTRWISWTMVLYVDDSTYDDFRITLCWSCLLTIIAINAVLHNFFSTPLNLFHSTFFIGVFLINPCSISFVDSPSLSFHSRSIDVATSLTHAHTLDTLLSSRRNHTSGLVYFFALRGGSKYLAPHMTERLWMDSTKLVIGCITPNQTTNQSTNQPINQPTNKPTNQPIN